MITHGSSPTPTQDSLRWLQLLQLADSAVPIGSTAHSFGLETLVEYRLVTVETLPATFRDFLREAGTLESVFCVAACSTKNPADIPAWCDLNATLDALQARHSDGGFYSLPLR
jgi:urease accessory protein